MKSEDCFGGPPPQSWLENISACQSPMYLRVGPNARGTYPEHPAPASLSGLSRLTHHQTQFSISRLIVTILHYGDEEGVGHKNTLLVS